MTYLVEQATTTLDQATAFAKVGDFANIHFWDPGVIDSVKTDSEPLAVGAAYDLTLSYGGRTLHMQYVVTELVPDRKVVLAGSGGMVAAVDTISFEATDGGTKVTYEAELSLTGIWRLFQPFMGKRFAALGSAAGDGMRKWLAELEQQNA
jgi:carbon monoxide dehydrogenase subunit G